MCYDLINNILDKVNVRFFLCKLAPDNKSKIIFKIQNKKKLDIIYQFRTIPVTW